MFQFRFDGFDPCSPVVIIRPKNVPNVSLAVNLLMDEPCAIRANDATLHQTLAPLARRFGTLENVYPDLSCYIRGSEEVLAEDSPRQRYGHICYRKRSLVTVKGRSGKVKLMTPILDKLRK